MFRVNRNVGKVNFSTCNSNCPSVNVVDGIAKLGDEVFTIGGTSWKLTEISVVNEKSISIDSNDEINLPKKQNYSKLRLDSFYQANPNTVFCNKEHSLGTFIANNKIAMNGDICWIWKGNTLVRKIIHNGRFHYEDNPSYLKTENTQQVFGSKNEAIKACPEKAYYLEAAFKRQGRIFEKEKI